MRERNWLAIILICIIIGVVLIPKQVKYSDHNEFGYCKCVGVKSTGKCLGKKFGCVTLQTQDISERVGKRSAGANNVILALDVSASMHGDPFIRAKKSAVDLIENKNPNDRMALLTYAQEAKLLHEFTADKGALLQEIENIQSAEAYKKTNHQAAVKKASRLFGSSDSLRKLIFVGDGKVEGNDSSEKYAELENALDKEVCVYALGYDQGREDRNVLKNFADMSIKVGNCGRFYYASSPSVSVPDVASRIYKDTSSVKLEIDVKEPITKTYQERSILVNFTTNIEASCSYSLNKGNKKTLDDKRFDLQAEFGKNTLEIYCRRKGEREWQDKKKVNFYVEGEMSFFQKIKEFFEKEKEISTPSKDDVKGMLREIFRKEKLSVMRQLQPKGEGTLVTLTIRNTKPLPVENVKINQIIPSSVVDDVEKLETGERYSILDSNPFVMEFYRESISPEEIISISYYIDKPIDRNELELISTEIRYEAPKREQVEKLFSMQNESNSLFDIKRTDNSIDSKEGNIKLQPKYNMNDVNVYLNIPKCMAVNLNEVYFKDKDYRIISNDPLIGWHYDEVKDNITIDYEAQSKVEDYCKNKISVLTLTDEVGDKKKIKQSQTNYQYFIPVIIIPLIILLIMLYMGMPEKSSDKRKSVLSYVLIIILIALLIWMVFPKDKITAEKRCSCFGIGYKDSCYGLPFSCKTVQQTQKTEKVSGSELCSNPSCNNVKKYMNADPRRMNEVGIDLNVILDKSKSMEGDKIKRAKKASIKLLSQVKEYDRISLITFDNTSTVAQEFSNDKAAIEQSIRNVSPGFTTKYVPPLKRAYYNFLSKGKKFNRWMVIFISDGEPKEDPGEIYNYIRQMANEGICVNTIGYGDEISPGNKAETILKEMARISKSTNGCGSYYYSPSSIDTLASVLDRLYKRVNRANASLSLDASVNSLRLTSEEQFMAKASVYSDVNNLNIPGTFRMESERYCVPTADVNLVLKDGDQTRKYAMTYNKEKASYILKTKQLPVGQYKAYVTAELGQRGCKYKGNYSLGELVIEKFKGFRKCKTQSCQDISEYLFEKNEKDVLKVLITDYAFIPQNISISEGTTVVWKNAGDKPHTVTSGTKFYDGFFHSGVLEPGETFNKTFQTSKNFQYFDNLSTRLKGYTHKKKEKDITFGNFKLEYKQPIDLSLIIDISASMYGEKMEQLKSAADHLINMVYPGDRVGVVKFSDYASMGQLFTQDRELLKRKIGRLSSGGSTRYIPALTKTQELYGERTNGTENGKVAVFLSDGHPWDKGKPESIYNKARELIDEGICIYTIGYGEEIYPGSEAQRLLQKIVKMSQESGNCGKYNYAPARETRLVKIFGSIYHDAAGDVKGLEVIPNLEKEIIYDNETLSLRAKVKSTFTNNYLPGMVNKSKKHCGPPAFVEAVIKNTNNKTIQKERMRFKGENTGYYASITGLEPGDYRLLIKARAVGSSGKTCEFKGQEKEFITVLNSEQVQVSNSFVALVVIILGLMIYLSFKRTP